MAKFTAQDLADFKQAYFRLMEFCAPLHEFYNSYERQSSPDEDYCEDVEHIRLQTFRLESFLDPNPLVMLGRVKFQMQRYLEDDEAGYLPGVMGEEAQAVYNMLQDDDAAVMMKGCALSNLILNVALFAGQPQANPSVRLALAENLRLACYFNEVDAGIEPVEAIQRFYPKDRARIAELPFSNSIDVSLCKVLDRAVKQVRHVEKPDTPEGYEWKRSEKKPHLRLLLKIS